MHPTGKAPHGAAQTLAFLGAARMKDVGERKDTNQHLIADAKASRWTVTAPTATRALQEARKLLYGCPRESYPWLDAWLKATTDANPGTLWDVQAGEDGEFTSLFVAFGGSIAGSRHIPPGFACVDGCHLGFGGTLLIAVGVDALGSQYPLAFAIIGNESKDSWGYFFLKLVEVFGDTFFGPSFGLMGDQDKGMQAALGDLPEGSVALKCHVHMSCNIKPVANEGGRFEPV
eukprot:TRINITY_DN3005_c0_g1_i10.p1 TRINITY_DN3005_c0_g1~~TRINITY_DN3005_c0_g1_i10.p1  ORF type:complete len:231 (+),score=29.35 TRINITY_DN3005_c0_g1_i10:146-838(+)